MLFLTSAASRGLALSRVHNVIRTSNMFAGRRSAQGHHILTLRQNVSATVSRWFTREIPRLPLDAENLASMITKDMTVFTYKNNRFFLMMTIFGGMQFLFWANLAVFIESYPVSKNSRKPQMSQKSSTSWMDTFYAENRTAIATACICLGQYILYLACVYFHWGSNETVPAALSALATNLNPNPNPRLNSSCTRKLWHLCG